MMNYGTRMASLHNGGSLFTGEGGGETNTRRYSTVKF